MSFIAAKPTLYRGIRFRSRLEARWAVFFDAVGYEWIYEPHLPELRHLSYQPDFLLNPNGARWALEVKPWPGEGNDWAWVASSLNEANADPRYRSVAELLSARMFFQIGSPGTWEQGTLTGYGSVAIGWDGNEGLRNLYEWAECPQCAKIDLWPDGHPMCCDRRLPTGPLYEAFGRVRDHSYEDA